MNSDRESILDLFVEGCDCENCQEKISKPNMFANIITVGGKSSIQVFDSAFKHLEEERYGSRFDALDVIKANNLTLLASF
jgi:hypothetical protein